MGRARFNSLDEAVAAAANGIGGTPTGRWTYHDREGDEVFYVVRFDISGEKEFRPFHQSNGLWLIADPPGKLPLYGLPDLIDAETVYVVEGEKCADALKGIGLTATTSAHGSQSPGKTEWSPLAKKNVIIMPDRDSAGERYARAVYGILQQQ